MASNKNNIHNKTLKTNKINEQVFKVRLKHNFKKATKTELLITMECLQQELNKRAKKGQI